jgi:hypothetical protein
MTKDEILKARRNNMTDEEKAEEYATENWERYEEGQNDSEALIKAFLAGLAEGRAEMFNQEEVEK